MKFSINKININHHHHHQSSLRLSDSGSLTGAAIPMQSCCSSRGDVTAMQGKKVSNHGDEKLLDACVH
jgi:hypothetical protein